MTMTFLEGSLTNYRWKECFYTYVVLRETNNFFLYIITKWIFFKYTEYILITPWNKVSERWWAKLTPPPPSLKNLEKNRLEIKGFFLWWNHKIVIIIHKTSVINNVFRVYVSELNIKGWFTLSWTDYRQIEKCGSKYQLFLGFPTVNCSYR